MSTGATRWLQNMTATQRKVALMLGLVGVGLLLWGRLLFFKDLPRTALADPAEQAAASSAPGETRRPVRPVVRVAASPRLERDLFALDASYFPPRRGNPVPVDPPVPAANKSDPQTADVQKQVSEARQGLVLQTTILGDRPRAVINGQVLSPGDKIGGFTLLKVLARGVILEMNGIEVRLDM